MNIQPAIFLSHGSPTMAVEDSPTARFLARLGHDLPRPRAILVASAHYEAAQPSLGAAARPATLHDFGGFPPGLYALQYPAPGAPDVAARAADLLGAAGMPATLEPDRPLDHGIWVALGRMYPDADIPVVPLAVLPRQNAAAHFRIGQALAPLRREGVLVIGSGGASHNLRELDWHAADDAPFAAWAREFTDWVHARLMAGETPALLDWLARAPHARRNHPTPEHFLPLFVALGAGAGQPATRLHHRHALGTISLDAWRFG
jgi:4,5-DOPA dioxygenase extradiol